MEDDPGRGHAPPVSRPLFSAVFPDDERNGPDQWEEGVSHPGAAGLAVAGVERCGGAGAQERARSRAANEPPLGATAPHRARTAACMRDGRGRQGLSPSVAAAVIACPTSRGGSRSVPTRVRMVHPHNASRSDTTLSAHASIGKRGTMMLSRRQKPCGSPLRAAAADGWRPCGAATTVLARPATISSSCIRNAGAMMAQVWRKLSHV